MELGNDDIIDSRELEERLEELKQLAEDNEINEEDQEELKMILEIKEECGGYGWEYGITFIRAIYFDEYAEEYFDNNYAHNIPENLRNYIDYKAFSRDLEIDYSSVDINGVYYYFKEV